MCDDTLTLAIKILAHTKGRDLQKKSKVINAVLLKFVTVNCLVFFEYVIN